MGCQSIARAKSASLRHDGRGMKRRATAVVGRNDLYSTSKEISEGAIMAEEDGVVVIDDD